MAAAVVVAAGRGERLGHGRPKALVPLAGRPMLEWSVAALQATIEVEEIVVVLPEEEVGGARTDGVAVVAGGPVRSESVRRGLAAVRGDPVIVHDAARPLATPALFGLVLDELARVDADGVIAAAPAADTLKAVEDGGVVRTVERAGLWAVQTPQAFRRAALERALAQEDLIARATDDAWLLEQSGGTVRVIDAGEHNFKVTTAADLHLAELVLRAR